MKPRRTPRVKICCIASVEEAALAVECGAAALGLVSHMPSGPGVIDEEVIAEIAATVPPAVGTFLLTSRQGVDDIVAQQRRCRTNAIQICDQLTQGTHRDLKAALPGISVVQVIHVTGPESIKEAARVAPHVTLCCLIPAIRDLRLRNWAGRVELTIGRSVARSGNAAAFRCFWLAG